MLRLKANYFWPAIWGSRFNEDDPKSPQLADDMGIVMETSHHEPMMRAHKEYVHRKEGLGLYYHIDMNGGPWNDRWVNTTTIPKLREQQHEAYAILPRR